MRVAKKEIILNFSRTQGFKSAGRAEIRRVEDELRRALGPRGKTSSAYIARVLQEAGIPWQARTPYAAPRLAEPYSVRLKGSLQFHDLASAESSLRTLDVAYRCYLNASDRVGASMVRSLLLEGKTRAQSIAANPRVSVFKRQEKREVALWFTVWLQTPEIFFDWLEMRKQTENFRKTFGAQESGLSAKATI